MQEFGGKFKKSMTAIIQNQPPKLPDFATCGLLLARRSADSHMQAITSLHLSFVGFVG
jgi:hypothetical protein